MDKKSGLRFGAIRRNEEFAIPAHPMAITFACMEFGCRGFESGLGVTHNSHQQNNWMHRQHTDYE